MLRAGVAILAKAPIPGFAKTRLVPLVGAEGAARLHADLVEGTLLTALAAAVGPVTLWCAPDDRHPFFRTMAYRFGARRPLPDLFEDMPWGTDRVAAVTRERARERGLRLAELRTVWDVDTPADLARLAASGLVDISSLLPQAARVPAR